MSDLKTRATQDSALKFIEQVENPKRRQDAQAILKLMSQVTKERPVMWGSSIVGFGSYHYKYASGKEGDWMRIGFSPRKANLTLYLMNGFYQYRPLLQKLGKHKTGKSCLYINKLEDIDMQVLTEMIHHSYFDACLGEEKSPPQ